MSANTGGAELWGVMPTFKRPDQLVQTLATLAQQTRLLDHLVIVDNGGDARPSLSGELASPRSARTVTLLTQEQNLGPAGALAVGLDHVLAHAPADAWVASFDDDDPPVISDTLEHLWHVAQALMAEDPRCGAVGFNGSRFDRRRVRVRALHNDELTGGPMPVAVLSGNHVPMVRLAALPEVGNYRSELFFGLDDFEFFLRMNSRGWTVYCDTDLMRRYRSARGRTGALIPPSRRLGEADWRRFYSIRNRVYIARTYAGAIPTARLVAELAGKVLANGFRQPDVAWRHGRLTARACADGLASRLGRTWSPDLTADGRLPSNAEKLAQRDAQDPQQGPPP